MTEEKKPMQASAISVGDLGLLREAPSGLRDEVSVAIVEWEDGAHTHLAFEVMAKDGQWTPLAAVSLQDCIAADARSELRQFPMFRLAWYGQVGAPSSTPQRLLPEQDSRVSSAAMTRP